MLGKRVGIRVDGNRHIGLGHIYRCLHLARSLKKFSGISADFYLLESSLIPSVESFFKREGFAWYKVSQVSNPWQEDLTAFKKLLKAHSPDLMVLDLLIPDRMDADLNENVEFLPADVDENIRVLTDFGASLFVISDQFDKMNVKGDVILNTCPAQRQEWYPGNALSLYLLGPDYYILADSFKRATKKGQFFGKDRPKRAVIFCGGNDHHGFTRPIVETLSSLSLKLELVIIIGAATKNGYEEKLLYKRRGFKAYFNAPDIAKILKDADFMISTAGNTLFDAAALGLPAAAVSTRDRQRITAAYFGERGSCIDLGENNEGLWERLAFSVREKLSDSDTLQRMSLAGQEAVDGRGIERIIGHIIEKLG